MPVQLNPYLSFRDNAREAMEFYQSVFGGELALSTFGEFGQPDSPDADKIMHGMLETPSGFTLMASDVPPGMDPGGDVSNGTISLSGDDDADLRGFFERLAEGGRGDTADAQPEEGQATGASR